MKSRAARFVIPLAISAVLLLLVINSVRGEADQLKDALGATDWRLIIPAIALYFAGVLLRSVRWGMLLPEYGLRLWTLFCALIVGFTVNNLLPFRMGEVARAYLLARWGQVPYGATVASLVVERVLDGLSLALLLLVALWLVPSAPGYLLAVGVIAGCGFFAGLGLLALAAWRASALTMFVGFFAKWMPSRLGPALVGAAGNFARSLAVVHDTARLARLIGLSLVAWCCELGLFYVLMFSVGILSNYPHALLVGAAANFATLLPSSPGYAGTFDAALTRTAQDVLNISAGLAGAYDIVVHATLFLPVVVVGTLVLWRSRITFDQVTHTPAPVADTQYSPLTTTRA
ncbi:MAG: flippase-like domain-containing protein [Chloroflexi bacterium]|nr:flippase-like domain-containing protein [Chloroflexota bacterium]